MAAEALLESGFNISRIFTSLLTRANFTVSRVLEVEEGCLYLYKILTHLQKLTIPEEKIVRDWRLNERHYGALTGLNKGEKLVKKELL